MIELITQYYEQFMAFANANPVVAGAISLWGLTVITFLLRTLPSKIYQFFYRNFVVEVHFNNGDWDQEQIMYRFLNWFGSTKWAKWSRSMSISVDYREDDDSSKKYKLSAGFGLHFFFFKGSLMWFNMFEKEGNATSKVKTGLTIRKLGFSKKKIYDLMDTFNKKKEDTLDYYQYASDDWFNLCTLNERPIESIAMEESKKQEILSHIDKFIANEDWYRHRGLSYKLTFVLYGKPGTGKTSLLRAIATHYRRNVYSINLHEMTDNKFMSALQTVGKNSIVVIEDFDSSKSVRDREAVKKSDDNSIDLETLTMSGILNALDGVNGLDDVIIFMTTNHIDKIDPAILRKGRTDHVIEIGDIPAEEVLKYSKYLYPDYQFTIDFKPIVGCHLHGALTYALDKPELYEQYLKDVYDSGRNLESR